MKKIIPILLALLLLVGLMPVSAFAEAENSETLTFDGNRYLKGSVFEVSAERPSNEDRRRERPSDEDGWRVGFDKGMKITALNTYVRITNIEAHVEWYGQNIGITTVSSGTIDPEPETVERNRGTVWINNVGEAELVIGCPDAYICFDKFVVYYECTHVYNSRNICKGCGKTKCDVEGHHYEKGVCTVCGHECENEFHNGVYVCPDCGMEFDPAQGNPLVSGSTLSDGNMTIIFTIVALAIGLCGGFVLGRKKKPTPANVVGNDEE